LPSTPVTLKALKRKRRDFEPRTLGEHIRKRRLELRLSQKEAAKRLGYRWTTVLNWENGKRKPGVERIPDIIAFLGYDPFQQPMNLSEELAALRRKTG
jgi:transcriptional regulator with XRE-family HTH domain